MKKNAVLIVLNSLALFFIGMSVFADKTTFIGILVSVIGYGCLLFASIISIITVIRNRKD